MNQQALKSVRRRFPGFERSMGSALTALAAHESAKCGTIPRKVNGWIEVRPKNPDDSIDAQVQAHWVAFLNAETIGGDKFRVPVIPDEFNPHPDKIVRPEDKPHVFTYMHEAEAAANAELPGFVSYLTSKL
jgi:hypothetical protein